MLAPFFWMQPSMWVGLIVERAHRWTCCPCWLPRSFITKLLSNVLSASAARWGYSAFGIHEGFFQLVEIPLKTIPPCRISLFSLVSSTNMLKGTSILLILNMFNVVQTQNSIIPWGMPLILANSLFLCYKTLFFQPFQTTSFPQAALCSSPIQFISLQLSYPHTIYIYTLKALLKLRKQYVLLSFAETIICS